MAFSAQINKRLKQLTPYLSHPKFNEFFKQIANELNDSERFLLKMELNRLAKPCRRVLDLREHTKGCQAFEYKGLTHFLDGAAKQQFAELLKKYNGVYNFAVYETLLSEAKIKPTTEFENKQQQSEVERSLAKPIQFGAQIFRSEERMHYSTSVELMVSGQRVEAKSKDISASGMRIKIESGVLTASDIVNCQFSELRTQFANELPDSVKYKVCWQRNENGESQAGLMLYEPEESQVFIDFINKFIRSYRKKYRLDACNTLESARNRLYEQAYFFASNALPMLISYEVGETKLTHVIQQKSNLKMNQFWLDENQQSQLPAAINNQLMTKALQQTGDVKSLYIYAFTHKQAGRVYHFSATVNELNELDLAKVYWGYGSRKENWRVFKLQMMELDTSKAENPVSIPESAGKEIIKRNRPLSERLTKHLHQNRYIALLQDITNELATRCYQERHFDEADLNQLMRFKLSKVTAPECQFVQFDFFGQRKEQRYMHRSQVDVEHQASYISGSTRNFSTNGLQIELERSTEIAIGDVIKLDFPELQQITDKYQLKALPYEVMAKNKNGDLFNLKAAGANHAGKRFFAELSRKNEALNQGQETRIIGLENALRNLFVQSISQVCAFYLVDDDQNKSCELVESVCGFRLNGLVEKFRKHASVELERIICDKFAQKMAVKEEDKPSELIVCHDKFSIVEAYWLDELNSDGHREAKINESLSKGAVWAVRFDVTDLCKIDEKYVELELGYLATFQPAGKQKLMQQLANLKRVGFLADITSEICYRFDLEAQHQIKNLEQQNTFAFDVFD